MDFKALLSGVELFEGLADPDLDELASIFHERRLMKGELLAEQGQPGDELYLVMEGFVEVEVQDGGGKPARVIVNLGPGQIIGEMSLVDQGPRSATVRAIHDDTIVQVARRSDFERLCAANTHIGYVVMRNIAADLSFKLRQRHLDA